MTLTGKEINSHGILMGKPERKRPLGSHSHSWDSIIMGIKQSDGITWTG